MCTWLVVNLLVAKTKRETVNYLAPVTIRRDTKF